MTIQKQTLIIAGAAAVLVFSGISIWKHFRPAYPRLGMDVMQVCGEVAGEETVKLLGGKGRVVVLRLPTGKSNDRMKSIQSLRLKGFERALKSNGDVEIIAVKDVVDEEKPVDSIESDDAGIALPIRQYRETIEMYPDADAIVCLAGNPFGSVPDFDGWPEKRPKCVLLEIIPQGAPELVAEGVVDIAFILCQSTPLSENPPQTPREWFDRMYEVVTRNTTDAQ